MFRGALAQRRCIVHVDAFYEWKMIEGGKPTTRRLRLQLSSVNQVKPLKRRADPPVRKLSNFAIISSVLIACSSLSLRARPNRKSTRFASHQAISASRAKPESPRSRTRVFGQRRRICTTMRATSSIARTGGAVDVRPPQLGRQQMTATEDVEIG
jgi:hypothetical protein